MYYAILYLTLPDEKSKQNTLIINGTIKVFKAMGIQITEIIMNDNLDGDYLKFRDTIRMAKRKRIDFIVVPYREMIHRDLRQVLELISESMLMDINIISFLDGDLNVLKSKYLEIEEAGVKELKHDCTIK